MEKYHSAKVIGDGTYGSVIRAVNSKTGKLMPESKLNRGDRSNKEDEAEVLQMGLVH